MDDQNTPTFCGPAALSNCRTHRGHASLAPDRPAVQRKEHFKPGRTAVLRESARSEKGERESGQMSGLVAMVFFFNSI